MGRAETGGAYVIDTAPGAGGLVGQVVWWWRNEIRRVVQPSWANFLELLAELSEAHPPRRTSEGLLRYLGEHNLNELRGFGGTVDW